MKYDDYGFQISDEYVPGMKGSEVGKEVKPAAATKRRVDDYGFVIGDSVPEQPEAEPHQQEYSKILEDATKVESDSSIWRRTLGDIATALAKTTVATGESGVGLIDAGLAYGVPGVGQFLQQNGMVGLLGKGISSEKLGNLAVRFDETQAALEDLYSPERQAAMMRIQQTDGILPKMATALNPENISALGTTALESVGPMLAGGAIGRGARLAGAGANLAGSAGEGLITAGNQLESGRQDSPTGLLSREQGALLGSSGALTGLISLGSGKAAKWLGLADVDTLLAQGTTEVAEKVLKEAKTKVLLKVVGGALQEGFLEELPQSVQETVAANLAAGRKWDEGLADSAAMGTLLGFFMGAGANAFSRAKGRGEAAELIKNAAQTQTVADDFLYLPTPVSAEGETQASPVEEGSVRTEVTSPVPPVESQSVLMAGNKRTAKREPVVQLKSGVEMTEDHAAFLLEKNYGLSSANARVNAVLLKELARGEGLSINEFAHREGVGLGILQEKAPGYTYEFLAKEGSSGSVKITKQEDGSWIATKDVLQPNGILEKSEQKLEDDADVLGMIRKVRRAGFTEGSFFQESQKAKEVAIDATKFTVAKNRVEGFDILNDKGVPVLTAFDSQEEAQKRLELLQSEFINKKVKPAQTLQEKLDEQTEELKRIGFKDQLDAEIENRVEKGKNLFKQLELSVGDTIYTKRGTPVTITEGAVRVDKKSGRSILYVSWPNGDSGGVYLDMVTIDPPSGEQEFFQSDETGGKIAGTPYFLTAPRAILSGEMNMPDNKPLPGTQILGRLQNVQGIKKLELDFYKAQGLEEFLKENRTLKDVAQWMEENGPKVEIKKLGADGVTSDQLSIKLSNLQHRLETLGYDHAHGGRFYNTTERVYQDAEMLAGNPTIPVEHRDLFAEYNTLYGQARSDTEKNESATARFTQVNPKTLENMPGAVDLLIKIPVNQTESAEEFAGRKSIRSVDKVQRPKAKYTSGHYDFPKPNGENTGHNLLSHVRGYMETLPDGRKVFHVFEVQSDWGQERREALEHVRELHPEWSEQHVLDEVTGKDKSDPYDVADDPLLRIYEPLALKAAISYAKSQGADAIAISDAQTAMLTEGHDLQARHIVTQDQLANQGFERLIDSLPSEILNGRRVYLMTEDTADRIGYGFPKASEIKIDQEGGMRFHYDKTLPKIAEKLTGSKGEVVEFGTHKNTMQDKYIDSEEGSMNRNVGTPRDNLILKNPDGTAQTTIRARMYSLEKAPDEFSVFQGTRSPKGVTFFSPTGEKIISLMQSGNFSTVVHEFGHIILPLLNVNQRSIVAKWATSLKIAEKDIFDVLEKKASGFSLTKAEGVIYQDVHELFATTFEEYMRTGKAPSTRLKELFRYCKNILTKIYLHAAKIPGSDLTPEISAVFDQFFLGETELYGYVNEEGKTITGRIRIPGGKIKNFFATIVRPNVDYEIVKRNGQPVIILENLTELPVMNLIRGESLTKEQRTVLGDRAVWVSPIDTSEELSIEAHIEGTVYSTEHLNGMELIKLEALARRLGIKLGTKKTTAHYPREVIEKLIQDVQIAKLQATNPDITYEELSDSIDVTQLPSETKVSWFDAIYGGWSSWLMDIVRTYKGGGTLQTFHFQKARKATDDSHAVIGEQNPFVLKVQKLVWNAFKSRTIKAMRDLNEGHYLYDSAGNRVGFIGNTMIYLDKKYSNFRTKEMSPEAKEVLVAMREFLDNQARIAIRENMSVLISTKDANGKVTETRVPFTTDPSGNYREVMPRSYTEDFWRILSQDSPVMRKQLAKAMSVAGGIEIQEAEAMLEAVKTKSVKEARLYLENERLIEVMPTHVALPNGRLVEILHTDPFTYVQRLQMKLALRVGFFRAYAAVPKGVIDPQTGVVTQVPYKVIDPKNLESMVYDFNRKTNGGGLALTRLFRALNGVPVTEKFTFNVDNSGYSLYRAIHELMMVKKALWLTKAAIVNVTEPVGAIGMVGGRRWMKTAYRINKAMFQHLANVAFQFHPVFKERLSNDHWTLMRDAAVRNGTMAPHLVRWSIDKKFALSSTIKNVSDSIVAASGTTKAISFGEYFVAYAGNMMADDLARGKVKQSDAMRLRVLGFTQAEIAIMTTGNTPEAEELYKKIPIRMVTTMLGTNTLPAERSLWRNWKFSRDVIAFDSYGATMARLYNLHLQELYLRRTGKPASKYMGWRKFAQDAWMVSNLPFSEEFRTTGLSKLGAGMVATLLRQVLTYGPASLLFIDWDDEEEGWLPQYFKFGTDMFLQSSMSGPLANFYNDYKQGNLSPLQSLEKAILPLMVVDDTIRLAWNMYQAPLGEKAHVLGQYVKSSTSASSAVATWVAIAHHGFSATEPKLRVAKRMFWDFYKEEKPYQSAFGGKKFSDSYDAYMAHAFELISRTELEFTSSGDLKATSKNKEVDNNVKKLLMKALQEPEVLKEGSSKVSTAISGKRLLTRLDPEAEKRLYKKIGPELYSLLQQHDEVLDWWSKRVKGE